MLCIFILWVHCRSRCTCRMSKYSSCIIQTNANFRWVADRPDPFLMPILGICTLQPAHSVKNLLPEWATNPHGRHPPCLSLRWSFDALSLFYTMFFHPARGGCMPCIRPGPCRWSPKVKCSSLFPFNAYTGSWLKHGTFRKHGTVRDEIRWLKHGMATIYFYQKGT